jgi:hypothetical protein
MLAIRLLLLRATYPPGVEGGDSESVITVYLPQNHPTSAVGLMVVKLVIGTIFMRSLHNVEEKNSYVCLRVCHSVRLRT